MAAARLSHVIRCRLMTRALLCALLLLAAACGGGETDTPFTMSRQPVSVRGWILDVKGAARAETPEMEIARRTELFSAASVWVENTQYASGGIAENGAFVVLDVPPQNAIIGFNAPGAENAQLVLKDIPGSADIFIPDLILQPGGATVLDPKKIVVRVAGNVDKVTPTGRYASVAGYRVPIVEAPLRQFADRRDYPNPGGFRPVATVR